MTGKLVNVLKPVAEEPVPTLEQKSGKKTMAVFVRGRQLSRKNVIKRNARVRSKHELRLVIYS